jgi:glycosyltransferase involved in cell wall biosynthesis
MKVAFDISILGTEEQSPQNRTGIYKSIEAVIKELLLMSSKTHAETFELVAFSSDFCQINSSLLAWQRILKELKLSIEAYPFLGTELLSTRQQWVLALSERKTSRKRAKQSCLLESLLFSIARPWYRKDIINFSQVISKQLPKATVVHIPFTRDLEQFPLARGLTRVVTCYDLTPILCEARANANPRKKEKFAAQLRLIAQPDWVCCISQSAKTDLLAFRPDLNPEQSVVTYLGAETSRFYPVTETPLLQSTRERYHIPTGGSYILSVCTHLPHKNMPFLIRNFLELCVKQAIADDVVLVLCGGKRKFTAEMETLLLGYPQQSHRVIVTGYVADDDLPALYSGATVFVLPSLYEGFGLPVLEAMQCGTPVLSSDTASLPEVGGDAALYASPTDDSQFQQQMVALLNSPELRQQMIEKGFKQAEKFSWEQSAKDTLAVYRQAYLHFLAGTPT